LIHDPYKLLKGTGNLIRHIAVEFPADYKNPRVRKLIKAAIDFAINDMDRPTKARGVTISKIRHT
jgi:hypothetical protein